MAIQKSSQTAQDVLHHFKSFLGKPRTELPWLNGTTHGFPNRVHGFYDCALAVSYFSGLRPIQVSCTAVKHLAQANKVWNTNLKTVIPGDFVLFDWESGKGLGKNTNTDHIGLVISVDVKHQTVTYVSADTGKVIPGIVTVNTVGQRWIAGFARLVEFAKPASVVPTVHIGQREVHSNIGLAQNVAPVDAPTLHTLSDAHSGIAPVAPVVSKPVATNVTSHIANPGYPGHYIQQGAHGIEVKYIQQQLHLTVDGIFGPKTHAAVIELQKHHQLAGDGIVGQLTWKALG